MIGLALRPYNYDGYVCWSFVRASSVEKRQFMTAAELRSRWSAATSRLSIASSPFRRFQTLSAKNAQLSISAMFSQLPSHELPTHLGDAPLIPLPWLELVLLSIWGTVSGDILSANSIATTLSASSLSDHRVCPSGAALHVMATRCASCLPLNLRFPPGRGRSLSALSSPSLTNRARNLATVVAWMDRASAILRPSCPSSAFKRASARFTMRTGDLPRGATSSKSERSVSVS